MRPRYETKQDVVNETVVMDRVVAEFPQPHIYVKLPLSYQIDYAVYRQSDNKMRMVCEIKVRDITIDTYHSLILSAHKVHCLVDWFLRKVPAVLFFQLNDGLYHYKVTTSIYAMSIKRGGRFDRNDWQDVEPVYHIPVDQLKLWGP